MRTPQVPGLAGMSPLGIPLDWSEATVVPDPKGRDGLVAVRFDQRPAEELRTVLKACRFGWSPAARVWIGRLDRLPGALAAGQELEDLRHAGHLDPGDVPGELEQALRQESGLEQEQGI